MATHRPIVPLIVLPLSLFAAGATRGDTDSGPFCARDNFRVAPGETRTGDVYVAARTARVSGRLDGDLVAWAANVRVDGEVAGDLFVGASQVDIPGRVGDGARIFASSVTISGEIDGDVLVFAATLVVTEGARIHGDLHAFVGNATVAGTLDRGLTLTTGEAEIDATIGGSAEIDADAIHLGPATRIGGDLHYASRRELEREEGAEVAGNTVFKEKVEDEEKQQGGSRAFAVAWWLWWTAASMLAGLVTLALVRRLAPGVAHAVGTESMLGTLIGFAAFLVVPAAALLAVVLVISLPLGLITLALYLVALYLAKMPVAVWLGGRLAGLVGLRSLSPYAGLLIGLLVLRLLYLVPYVGFLIWLVTTWLGLGATILALRARLQQGRETPAAP